MRNNHFYTILFVTISLFVILITALRSYFVPFNHDEAATFFFYIQTGQYMPFFSHVDANNHVLNSFLSNICFKLFGSHPFVLRIPNILGLIVLIAGTYKISKQLNYLGSKVILSAAFLLSFHWLSFFSACRGYGLSMGLLLLGTAYLINYINNTKNIKQFVLTLLFYQLAISANLILIVVVLLLSAVIGIYQLYHKDFFMWKQLLIWLIHLGLIYYWLSFSFYLQDNGALYYGEGESYWKVSFESLILLLLGYYSVIIKWLLVVVVVVCVLLAVYVNRLLFKHVLKKPNFPIIFGAVFFLLVLGFYMMHKLLGVNYPEDRTGLFFYLFFMLFLVFTFDKWPFQNVLSYLLIALLVIHFIFNINFRKHSLNVYETIPEHFYTTLLKEQEKSSEQITIGGHRVRELFYGFMNYRNGAKLYPADPVELMQMNCDYYIGTKQEEKYFKPYYHIIDTEPDWGFVLLKRNEKIIRNKILESNQFVITENSNEFIGLFSKNDTTFTNHNPLIAEIDIDIIKMPVPVNVWFVLQVNDSLDNTVYFKRYPLQWSGYNLNGKKHLKCNVTVGNLPNKSKKIACFFWNIDKKPLSIKINSFKISQLKGKGVDYEAPDIK